MTGFRLFLLLLVGCIAFAALVGSWLWGVFGGDVTGELERIARDAQEFASAHEQEDCVPEAFGRLEVCDGVWCKVQTPFFTRECLRRAMPSPELCDSVPDSLPLALVWPTTTCTDIDAEPEICQRILRELVTVCFASES